MGYAEGRRGYYIARFKDRDGRWPTVKDTHDRTIQYRTKREAKRAADDEEAKVRANTWRDPRAGQMGFPEWANRWYAGLDLAPSTMQNYQHHIEEHLLPAFETYAVGEILGRDVDAWERRERDAGYKPSSIKTWRTTLSIMLADAVEAGLIDVNPVARRRGRGKRAGRSRRRGPEKATTDALGALLIAERASILSGRDAEFVAVTTKYYTGMRWAEIVGLEVPFVRLRSIRVEWQLWEADDGVFHRLPPKDDSYRDIDAPLFLSRLLSSHISRTAPQPCDCHGLVHVFAGRSGSAHWRRTSFGDWIFEPAARGWFPKKRASEESRPVPLAAEPWPGRPLRGRNNQGRAELCWTPISAGLTPHGLRHSHKTCMVEMRTPEILSHERLGHELEGIGGRYSHVTEQMRNELTDGLTERWETALDARLTMHPRSPVPVLDELLRALAARKQDHPTDIPQREAVPLRARPQKGA